MTSNEIVKIVSLVCTIYIANVVKRWKFDPIDFHVTCEVKSHRLSYISDYIL